jgi:hypothetical protein
VVVVALVVTVNIDELPSMVRVAFVLVENKDEDVRRTTTISPGLTDPVPVVNGRLLILYSPPTILIEARPVIPDAVTELDIY